jgi:hypothetical protein
MSKKPQDRQTEITRLQAEHKQLRDMLLEVQKRIYHEPDSDGHEYCAGCGRSPYWSPNHTRDCLVPRISDLLAKTDGERIISAREDRRCEDS